MNQTYKEEIANTVTHGVGAVLSILALVSLAWVSDDRSLIGYLIFGVSLVVLYLASTIYHAVRGTKVKSVFRKLDHIAIFILIAGTYTPFCLISLEGPSGKLLLALTWGLALVGIILKVFYTGKFEWLSLLVYIAMGWIVVFFIKPVYLALSAESFGFLLAGGIAYTAGIFFYANKRIKYTHAIWHGFVLLGSTFHYLSVIHIPS